MEPFPVMTLGPSGQSRIMSPPDIRKGPLATEVLGMRTRASLGPLLCLSPVLGADLSVPSARGPLRPRTGGTVLKGEYLELPQRKARQATCAGLPRGFSAQRVRSLLRTTQFSRRGRELCLWLQRGRTMSRTEVSKCGRGWEGVRKGLKGKILPLGLVQLSQKFWAFIPGSVF